MECCSICFLEFTEKPSINLNNRCRFQKFLSCGHNLCFSCYLKLQQTKCPFCRTDFTYSFEDLFIKNKKNNKVHSLNIQGNNQNTQIIDLWQPPTATEYSQNYETSINEPFSRLKKNTFRKRRRNLSVDELLLRRQNIKKRCQRKWSHKNGRLAKEKDSIGQTLIPFQNYFQN